MRKIIHDYAREPGVRTLQQFVEKIARKSARQRVERGRTASLVVPFDKLDDILGPQRFFNETAERTIAPGIVTGLAWTAAGGDILFIEAIALEGKGELKLTGQMGEVMVESARIALSHVHKYLVGQKKLKLASAIPGKDGGVDWLSPAEWFKKHDIHLHIPAGAVPKDGPSAGITMATGILSLATGRLPVRQLAMTGELSLAGKVLPVGGIKEKVLAAKRAGVKKIILPKLNKKDLKEIPPEHKKGLKLYFAERADDVFKNSLL